MTPFSMGMGPTDYQLDFHVSISRGHMGERLNVDEQMKVSAADFMEICAILGRFHELAEKIKTEQSKN